MTFVYSADNMMDSNLQGAHPYFVAGVDTLWDDGFMPTSVPKNELYVAGPIA